MDTRIEHGDAIASSIEASERMLQEWSPWSTQDGEEYNDDHQEEIVGTVVHPSITMTRDTILNNVIINDIAPKTASAEASSSPLAPESALPSSRLRGPHRSCVPRRTSTGPLLSTGTLSLGASTASPSPSM